MVVLNFRLFVVFCLIGGRYAYKDYLSDDGSEYSHESSTSLSQINSNEPPGKLLF